MSRIISDCHSPLRLTAFASASTKDSRRYRRRPDLSLELLLLVKVAAIPAEFAEVKEEVAQDELNDARVRLQWELLVSSTSELPPIAGARQMNKSDVPVLTTLCEKLTTVRMRCRL